MCAVGKLFFGDASTSWAQSQEGGKAVRIPPSVAGADTGPGHQIPLLPRSGMVIGAFPAKLGSLRARRGVHSILCRSMGNCETPLGRSGFSACALFHHTHSSPTFTPAAERNQRYPGSVSHGVLPPAPVDTPLPLMLGLLWRGEAVAPSGPVAQTDRATVS